MKSVEIYTDGACSGNPGPGGWCAILIYKGTEKIASGGEPQTTNNRMEIMAVIGGLTALKEPCNVKIFSDSAYVVTAFNENWFAKWIAKGWKIGSKDVKNIDLWQELLTLTKKHSVSFIKVKGHSDNVYNNRCDEIARGEIKKLNPLCDNS